MFSMNCAKEYICFKFSRDNSARFVTGVVAYTTGCPEESLYFEMVKPCGWVGEGWSIYKELLLIYDSIKLLYGNQYWP